MDGHFFSPSFFPLLLPSAQPTSLLIPLHLRPPRCRLHFMYAGWGSCAAGLAAAAVVVVVVLIGICFTGCTVLYDTHARTRWIRYIYCT